MITHFAFAVVYSESTTTSQSNATYDPSEPVRPEVEIPNGKILIHFNVMMKLLLIMILNKN